MCSRFSTLLILDTCSSFLRYRSKSIQFELMSNLEVQSVSELHVYERNLYAMPQRTPLEHGVLDPRLVRPRKTQPDLVLAV